MIFEKFKNLNIDRTTKAMIGMSRKKFDELVPVFIASYHAIQEERLKNKEIKCLPKGGFRGALDTHEKQLFFLLFYLKTYPTFDVIGFLFDLSAGHAHDAVKTHMPILKKSLETLNVYPKRAFESVEDFTQAIEKYEQIIIDGVEVPCVRPSEKDRQKDHYSGKKNSILSSR